MTIDKVMTVDELINKLEQFDKNLEVSITDGYKVFTYQTDDIEIELYEDFDKQLYVDIGIGGCEI